MAQQSPDTPTGTPRWLWIGGVLLLTLLVLAASIWLLFGGTQRIVRLLPAGLVQMLGETPGQEPVAKQELTDWPGHQPGRDERDRRGRDQALDRLAADLAAQEAANTADPAANPNSLPAEDSVPVAADPAAEQAAAVTAHIRRLAAEADTAIAAVGLLARPDQAVVATAERAVEALRKAPVSSGSAALRQAAEELRAEQVLLATTALEQARLLMRSTHKITADGPVPVYQAANAASAEVCSLEPGTWVRLHLDTGTGWGRIEATTGPATGKGGYAKLEVLQALKRATSGAR
jgi:hypothetical protein